MMLDAKLRISASNLVRLQLPDGRYVVELNRAQLRRGIVEVTPLGGGTSVFRDGIDYLASIGAKFEKGIDGFGVTDLRLTLAGSQLDNFRSWFHSRNTAQRECSSIREFFEEIRDEHLIAVTGTPHESWSGCREYFAISPNIRADNMKTLYLQEVYDLQLTIEDITMIQENIHYCDSSNGANLAAGRLLAVLREDLIGHAQQSLAFAPSCLSLL